MKHKRPPFWVTARCDLPCRFVIHQMLMHWRGVWKPQATFVELYGFIALEPGTEFRDATIDGDTTFTDPAFDLPPGTMTGGSQDFLDAFGQII